MHILKIVLAGFLIPTLALASYLGDPVVVKSGGTGLSTVPSAGQILIGNAGGTAYALALLNGEATMASTGAVTLTNSAVIGKVLTGYTSGAGTVAATDTILQAIQKLNGNIVAGSGITQLTSDVTAGPGSGSQAATIAANAVTNAKAAQMAAHTYKGNNTGSTANALDLTTSQVKTDLAIACADITNASASCTIDTSNAANISSGTLPAGRMPALTGDVTTSAGAVATTIANLAVTNAKIANSTIDLTAKVTGLLPAANVNGGRAINPQTGTTYTFALADASNAGGFPLVTGSNASAETFTVPPQSSVVWLAGAQIDVCQIGAGKLTLAQGAGVTINSLSGNKALGGQYVCVTLVRTASDTWLLTGNLIP